jgi:hypothetical protein
LAGLEGPSPPVEGASAILCQEITHADNSSTHPPRVTWATEGTQGHPPIAAERLSAAGTPPEDPPAPEGNAAGASMAPAPVPPRMEPGADLPGFMPSEADHRLDTVYGDHPHQNDGTHLSGGWAHDNLWQKRWRRVAELPSVFYNPPQGRVGRRFVATLKDEFQGVRECKWNLERVLIFPSIILQ